MPNSKYRVLLSVSTLFFSIGMPSFSMAENLIGTSVVLRTLDKVTATTKDYTVQIGDTLQYGSLSVDVKHCEKKPPEDIPETYAFLQIYDNRMDGRGEKIEGERLFSGWMLASKPAMSALEHAVYDVWVLGCNVPKKELESASGLELKGTQKPPY